MLIPLGDELKANLRRVNRCKLANVTTGGNATHVRDKCNFSRSPRINDETSRTRRVSARVRSRVWINYSREAPNFNHGDAMQSIRVLYLSGRTVWDAHGSPLANCIMYTRDTLCYPTRVFRPKAQRASFAYSACERKRESELGKIRRPRASGHPSCGTGASRRPASRRRADVPGILLSSSRTFPLQGARAQHNPEMFRSRRYFLDIRDGQSVARTRIVRGTLGQFIPHCSFEFSNAE